LIWARLPFTTSTAANYWLRFSVRTSLVTEFDTAISYDVTAGVGPFNESYVSSFFEDLNSTAPDYPFSILPYSYYGMVNNLITNSAISTVVDSITCRDEDADCAAYLLSGGVWETAPWMPPGFEDHPIVRIDNVPAVQVDFQGKHGPKDFNTTDCQLLGSDEDMIAAEICVRATKSGAIYAGSSRFIRLHRWWDLRGVPY